jgi:hypothetical protein
VLAAIAVAACAADRVTTVGSGNDVILARLGQEVDITLGNVGPATYQSPPDISAPVLSYLGVGVVPPYTPAGPNQQFRFKAVSRGDATVEFRRTLQDSLVSVVTNYVSVR